MLQITRIATPPRPPRIRCCVANNGTCLAPPYPPSSAETPGSALLASQTSDKFTPKHYCSHYSQGNGEANALSTLHDIDTFSSMCSSDLFLITAKIHDTHGSSPSLYGVHNLLFLQDPLDVGHTGKPLPTSSSIDRDLAATPHELKRWRWRGLQ